MSNIIDISNLDNYKKEILIKKLSEYDNIKLISINDINKKFFNSFEKIKKEDEYCTICLDIIKKNQHKCNLNCNHIFHKKCIKKYFNKNLLNFSCPNCKESYDNKIKDLIIN